MHTKNSNPHCIILINKLQSVENIHPMCIKVICKIHEDMGLLHISALKKLLCILEVEKKYIPCMRNALTPCDHNVIIVNISHPMIMQ
jgi:hypothetical protein